VNPSLDQPTTEKEVIMTPTKNVSKFDYLRHRRFLIIQRFMQPTAQAYTSQKGWAKQSNNCKTIDHPSIVQRISNTIMRRALVIIDLTNDTVIKNRLRCDASAFDDEVLAHYKSQCAEMIR
jgi:hypothetical protein